MPEYKDENSCKLFQLYTNLDTIVMSVKRISPKNTQALLKEAQGCDWHLAKNPDNT